MKYIASIIFLFGLMVTGAHADDEELFKQMLLLAQHGDAEAQYHVGMFYNNGIGTSKNIPHAFEWFQKSSSSNNPLGAYKVGCYYSGQGRGYIDVDHAKALEYKMVAAKAGYALAQYDVASLFLYNGNIDEAIKWWRMAGDQGHFDSLYTLFNLYYQGKKISRDLPSAYLYLKLAIATRAGEPSAQLKSVMNELINTVSQADRDKMDKSISEWKIQPTELTIKAMQGLREAEDYLKNHVPQSQE